MTQYDWFMMYTPSLGVPLVTHVEVRSASASGNKGRSKQLQNSMAEYEFFSPGNKVFVLMIQEDL
jgi:hypothetical protein